MSKKTLTDRLNDAIAVEHTMAMHCFQYEMRVSGLWRVSLAPLFKDLADEARDHARLFGQKVVALGGSPACTVGPVADADAPEAMVDTILTLEHEAMKLYRAALEAVPSDDVAMRNMLEEHIDGEQKHIDELTLVAGRSASSASKVRRAS